MLRYTTRINSRLHFSVSSLAKNYNKELESLINAKQASDTIKDKPKTSGLNNNTEDSLKKLFESFSQKSKKYPAAGFRPMLRKKTTNNSNIDNSSTSSRFSEKPRTPKPLDTRRQIQFDKIPNDMENLVTFLAEKLPSNVLVKNPKSPKLSTFMTKYEALNFVNWNEQGIKIINENLKTTELKDIINDDTIYIPFPSHYLISVIQIVDKNKMPLQQYKDQMKMKIIKTFGSQELVDKIEDREQTLKKKELKEKASNTFKVVQIKWECQKNDLTRKLNIATKYLKANEKVDLVMGPEHYLTSSAFRFDHHPRVYEYTRSKIGSTSSMPNEKEFKEELHQIFEKRHFNRRMSIKQRSEVLDIITAYLDEHQAKYKIFADLESLAVISVHSAVFLEDAATNKAVDPRSSKQKREHDISRTRLTKDKLTPPSPKKKQPVASTTDMYSIKIED